MDAQQNVNRVYTKPTSSASTSSNVNTNAGNASTDADSKKWIISSKKSELKIKTLSEYLVSLPKEMLESLYTYPSICLAVFRDITDLARQYILRMLFVPLPVPVGITWTSQNYAGEQNLVDNELTKLLIWRKTAMPGGLPAWELSPNFRRNLKTVIIGGGNSWDVKTPTNPDIYRVRSIAFLDNYAMSRWRSILHFLVGIKNDNSLNEVEVVSPESARVLMHANLMRQDIKKKGVILTPRGFQFLLLDSKTQVWHFMLKYLDTCHEINLSVAECLSLLFELSFCTLGREYTAETFNPRMLKFLQHLREFGLVYQRKRKDPRFYPTRLVIGLTLNNTKVPIKYNALTTSGNSNELDKDKEGNTDATAVMDMEAESTGFIIVETNFRLYAHTNSELHVAVLALFTEIVCRMPKFVVGIITRESVKQSYTVGITANQIVHYLERYAHPAMSKNEHIYVSGSILPPNLVDQIRLWELERNRLKYMEGVMYNHFLSQTDYNVLRDYGESIKAIIWQNERNRILVVHKSANEEIKKYWKKYSKGGSK